MALQLQRRFDQLSPRLVAAVHILGGSREQRRALLMLVQGQQKPFHARAVVSGNVRADMSELVKVSNLRQWGSKYTKARTCARASEGGQESSSASIATLACQLSLVNSWNCLGIVHNS